MFLTSEALEALWIQGSRGFDTQTTHDTDANMEGQPEGNKGGLGV